MPQLCYASCMENTVTLGEDTIVYISCQGEQDYENAAKLQREVGEITKQLRAEQKPIRVHVDLRKLGEINSEARKLGLTLMMKTLDNDRIALIGQDMFTKYLLHFMIAAAGKEATIKYFSSSDEAKKWLLETNQ
jgi:hypothetical protein